MEDEVLRAINEICDEEEAGGDPSYCTSSQCRLDAACFVLNRLDPLYVTSGRGLAHVQQEYGQNSQVQIDMYTLAHEGLRRVTYVQRAYYKDEHIAGRFEGPHFNFPTIKGRLFNGVSFEAMHGIDVELRIEGELVQMMDDRFQNPLRVVEMTPGMYIFWPRPIAAGQVGEVREFELELRSETEGFEAFHHFFTLPLTAQAIGTDMFRFNHDLSLTDLYMLPA